MYFQNYEDYMRSVLGYPMVGGRDNPDTYDTMQYSAVPYDTYANPARYSSEIMDLYPDIYRLVNPMIAKLCGANTKPITRELLEQMTDEIYSNLESQPEVDTVINVRVNTSTPVEKNNRTSITASANNSSKSKTESAKVENRESREDRQRRPDNTLRDLIKILILNQLLGDGGSFPPGRPPRPRPSRPPMRPPYPRNDGYYDEYFKF